MLSLLVIFSDQDVPEKVGEFKIMVVGQFAGCVGVAAWVFVGVRVIVFVIVGVSVIVGVVVIVDVNTGVEVNVMVGV